MTLLNVNHRPVAKHLNQFLNDFAKDLNPGVPPVNIYETANAYLLELSAPGRNKEDFNVSIENGLLTIGFERKEENKNEEVKAVRKEFSHQSFKRSFTLDEKIDAENISAKYENGLLKFTLPKKELAETKKQISIQ